MTTFVRNSLAVATAWLLTFVGFAFAGYILANSGPFGEIAHDAAATGEAAVDVARSRAHDEPEFVDDVWRALERGQRFMDWIYFPSLAAALGLLLGRAISTKPLVPLVLGLLPFSLLALNPDPLSGSVHVALAFGVAWSLLLWRRRHVR